MSESPLWREEFPVQAGDERYVSRRQFAKFLTLTSLGMFAGNLWIVLRARWQGVAPPPPAMRIASAAEVPVGSVRLFNFPGPHDPCILVRTAEDRFYAYSQKCTHLSCAVYYEAARGTLECPCHNGRFALEDGRVLAGPPPRPLPRIRVERRGEDLVAIAVEGEA
jgi:Rieske Fe-S protein